MTEYELHHRNQVTSLTKLHKYDVLDNVAKNEHEDIYARMKRTQGAVVVEDISILKHRSKAEQALLDNDIKSLVLSPILDEEGTVISVLEIGSVKANDFNAASLRKLEEIFDILKIGYRKYMDELENRITSIIQEKYTSIHPSVQWKFQNVAMKHLTSNIYEDQQVVLDSIVFSDVFPLYAQSDIVGSSKLRNSAIQADLIQNLEELSSIINKFYKKKKLPLLDAYHVKLTKVLNALREKFVSNDETKIVNLITHDIHPLLEKLNNRHPELFAKTYAKYKAFLDPELGIIYNKRKDFEQSVNKLNLSIAKFLEKDNLELQKTLPHYFEKYKTDGVEYNMYVGQSILEDGEFDYEDLRNFRLWQLINTCEIVRLVEKIKPSLTTNLDTAQLIFAYNHALSIRFRMDEKRFDVDGAYNVRYEILKKRIDKAIIKGTKERLTLAGKIAIVYLSDTEKNEYIQFFEYLADKGYINEDYEDLELDKLQGAEGLKALRITVV